MTKFEKLELIRALWPSRKYYLDGELIRPKDVVRGIRAEPFSIEEVEKVEAELERNGYAFRALYHSEPSITLFLWEWLHIWHDLREDREYSLFVVETKDRAVTMVGIVVDLYTTAFRSLLPKRTAWLGLSTLKSSQSSEGSASTQAETTDNKAQATL